MSGGAEILSYHYIIHYFYYYKPPLLSICVNVTLTHAQLHA